MRNIASWKLLQDTGIISTDHIPAQITFDGNIAQQIRDRTLRKAQRVMWNHNKLDEDILEAVVILRTWQDWSEENQPIARSYQEPPFRRLRRLYAA